MPDLHRHSRLTGDGECLVERVADPLRLAPDVTRVDPAVLRRHPGEGDQLRSAGEASWLVDQAGRDAERTLPHRRLHQLLHPRQLLLVGLYVLEAEDDPAY